MPARGADAYRLTPAARRDLAEIWQYSASTWSERQADSYVSDLESAFSRLATHPELGRLREEFRPPMRIYRIASHFVIFTVEPEAILIIRVRHVREDWASGPFGQ